MATDRTETVRGGPPGGANGLHRVVIVADEAIGDESLVREVLRHTKGRPSEVMIVAPALVTSPLDLAAGDVDDDISEARRRLDESIAALDRNGIKATGRVGEADPNLALEDALRLFPAHEVIMVVHPREHRNWMERGVVEKARDAVHVPVTVIEVDADGDSEHVRDVKEVSPRADASDADRAQAAFEAAYLPPMPRRDRMALLVGPLGCIALAVLAIDCADQLDDLGSMDAGCYVSWIGGIYAFIVTIIHLPSILLLQGQRYARGLRNFMSLSVLVIVPLLVAIAAIAFLLS
jgi:hypothetical protein